jgi:hypothetical protein
MRLQRTLLIFSTAIGALITYVLSLNLGLGPIISASIVGLAGAFLGDLIRKGDYKTRLPLYIYCGAFVGMSSVLIMPNLFYILISGMIAGLAFSYLENKFIGFGGKLGFSAFIGVGIVFLLSKLIRW